MSTHGGFMVQEGIWLSILEYATVKKSSISTIRRSIKSGVLKHKEENGKYYIWTKEAVLEKEELSKKLEIEFLKKKNRELKEEVEDLKMLLQVYESNMKNVSEITLPPIPEMEQ
jgi:hypothetical protein